MNLYCDFCGSTLHTTTDCFGETQMKTIKAFIIGLILMFSINLKADIGTDKIAHAGTSYVIHSLLYGIHKKLGMDQQSAAFFATVETLILGGAKEVLLDKTPDGEDMIANTVGVGISNLVVIGFDF